MEADVISGRGDAGGPVVVVLAAGRGSRFSAAHASGASPLHKLAQPFDGATVIGRTLTQALRCQLGVVVVTTAGLLPQVTLAVAQRDVVLLPEVDVAAPGAVPLGMGASIAAGVAARPHARGWLVLPGDMPRVQPETLRRVALELGRHTVVYAQHRGRRGHPVGFAAELYSELVQLSGDEGARRLVARYPAFGFELDDPGVLIDIDTPADLERARKAPQLERS